ncbi:MAG: pyridoxal 5-phosphate synthase pdxT subunit [Abditibacteriota bacterium]|nr:pyridoxal 5-phosphate synthase pdxT subunit [Abditibacteriota bacterium]
MNTHSSRTIGVLALQGDFQAHAEMLRECGVEAIEVRSADDLQRIDGLVIPGGESTTMSRLCDRYGLWEPLRARVEGGMGVFGTCAGLIMLAKNISGGTRNFAQSTLGALDIDVARNAYGKQLDSFEANLDLKGMPQDASKAVPLHAVFIRAPRIDRVGEGVEVLARHNDAPVVVRHQKCMGAAFHPEIAGDTRLHQLWLDSLQSDAPSTAESASESAPSKNRATRALQSTLSAPAGAVAEARH